MSIDQKSETITVIVNGKTQHVNPRAHSSLLSYLRNELRLTGAKEGCAMGHCGACTVLVDNVASQACQLSLAAIAGNRIDTIEHIAETPVGREIGNALIKHDAAQCGYCLPGIVVTSVAELSNATNSNAIDALQRNLCRCGTHSRILKALQEVIDTRETALE